MLRVDNHLEEIMKLKDVRQKELAAELGYSYQQVQHFMKGRRIPRVDVALRIADCLDVDVRMLWDYEEVSVENLHGSDE